MRPRLLWRLVAVQVTATLAYRGAFVVLMLTTVIGPLISLGVWLTVGDQGVRLPLDRSQFVTYYVLLSVVSMLTAAWMGQFVAEDIRLGRLSPWLLRPAPRILPRVSNNIGEKIVKLPLLLPMVLGVALLFWNDLRPPTDAWAWGLFLVCLPFTAATNFLLDYLLGSTAFWLEDVNGLLRLKFLVAAFLSGQFVPLALFPPEVAPLLEAQPFRYTLSFPLEVVTGALTGEQIARGFAWQLGYLVALIAATRLVWWRGLRAYSASGG